MNDEILRNGLTKEQVVDIGINLGVCQCNIIKLLDLWEWDYEDVEGGILSNEDILCEYLTLCICMWGELDGK
jgi:hypothetical protein